MALVAITLGLSACAGSQVSVASPGDSRPALFVTTSAPSEARTTSGRELLIETVETSEGESQTWQARLASIREAYRGFEFEESLARTGELQQTLEAEAQSGQDFDALYEAHLLRGMSELALGRQERAETAFRAAVVLRPDQELDPGLYPPDVVNAYNQVRQTLRAEPPIALPISTSPVGATIEWDGRARGAAPISLSGLPGTHYVRVSAPGYQSRVLPVRLHANMTPLTVDLPRSGSGQLYRQFLEVPAGAIDRIPEETRERLMNASTTRIIGRLAIPNTTDGAELVVTWLDLRNGRTQSTPVEAFTVDELSRTLSIFRASSLPSTDEPPEDTERAERRRRILRSPILWSAVGAVVLGAVGYGIYRGVADPAPELQIRRPQ